MINNLKKIVKKIKFLRIIYFNFNNKFKHFKKLNLNSDSVVIDLGANIGLVSEFIYKKYNCFIYSYEPNTEIFNILKKRFRKNKKVRCFNYGISDDGLSKKLYFQKNYYKDKVTYSVSSTFLKKKLTMNYNNFIKVNTRKIEDIINSFEYIDLIKIDIEGYEYKIIPNLIKNKNKIKKVICELHGDPKKKYSKFKFLEDDYKELISKLKKEKLLNNWFIVHH